MSKLIFITVSSIVIIACILFFLNIYFGFTKAFTFSPPENYLPANVSEVDSSGKLTLKTEIGSFSFYVTPDQAYSISKALRNEVSERPLTHDLFKQILFKKNIEFIAATIDKEEANTIFATIYLRDGLTLLQIDSRPSDAIAIALRTNSKIYIAKELVLHAQEIPLTISNITA
ncbi:MAG: bifunctional nuclease family protein [Candidatus Parvarchaeota archaeon]|nr:bifunctional nuclease family protein [Candidatus Jingweiarchaeum tengchongense]MCW1297856.1 bifunctional nuclease family protein [Candidatus Jingweiarchaeum tengchongense]MCW1299867.1 bifunctional nuclease family protein [Candidatus Jingweiarchaeum tengchongense]MCW1304163.1 bifunctional nuclease family protein [Candidatus Jingweiarchaeum tengchongense]MCW1305191.1 bifunctional nuclease family protein [Candidatus Jingweiarchaeum tengchongense]